MEVVVKLVISAIVVIFVYYECLFLIGVWRSQIDPKATISRLIETLKPKPDIIATREAAKIYQDGKVVGDISGRITEEDAMITFERILNASELKSEQPFEYRRSTLIIVSIGERDGSYSQTEIKESGVTTITGKDVLLNVKCKRLPK